jgi:LPS export ABC transporter protein LptC
VIGVQRGFLLAALAASVAALGLQLSARQAADADNRRADLPDVAIERPFWQVFDANGSVRHALRADRLEQWPGESQARLVEPRLAFTDARAQRWAASARSGWITDDQQRIVLQRQVTLQRESEKPGLVITTEHLRITRQGDVIESDRPVVLASGSWHFTASGLRAEPGRQQLQLLGNVRGIHD